MEAFGFVAFNAPMTTRAMPPSLGAATAPGWAVRVLCLGCALCAATPARAEGPQIERVSPLAGQQMSVEGDHFGAPCASCEVQADYGNGFRYALVASTWTDRRIVVSLPDINASTQVWLRVVTAKGASEKAPATVRRELRPHPVPTGTVTAVPPDLQLWRISSSLKVGNRGEEVLDVSQPPPACGQTTLLFDHARIAVGRQRFGEAAIVASPPAGCTTCTPLRVRWFHEPTGQLDVQIHVIRRRVEGICASQRR